MWLCLWWLNSAFYRSYQYPSPCHSNQQAEAKYYLNMFGVIMLLLKVLISHTRRDVGERVTSHWPRSPVSCSRDQMLWMRPACSGCVLVFPHKHWCFSMRESYTRPGERDFNWSVILVNSVRRSPRGQPCTGLKCRP